MALSFYAAFAENEKSNATGPINITNETSAINAAFSAAANASMSQNITGNWTNPFAHVKGIRPGTGRPPHVPSSSPSPPSTP